MTSISDSINRHVNYIVDKRMQEATNEIKIRGAVESSLDYTVTQIFSAEAIGRAAAKLDDDRVLALQVIAAAFGAMDPDGVEESRSGESSCVQCNAPIGFTISGFTLFPKRVICPNCGVMGVPGT
ncbi:MULTISPECIES: hypothetical protein [Cryobacterium]|uniref:Hydrogenase maturation nickel metallochaperone HypA n=1 Tax=Cryobacterium breve TaxID=1259258 RepID=A0ABY2J930_9MICO|nr:MULTISPECIES: hypothetical protein [Cryobacterium]TFC91321.1 hypothetical protein E3T20_13825 [Cryobacterium sp. TmT3-12]TFD01346.1 hypothetical protein E3O65_01480 [Cryobacterium breve]